MEPMDILTDVPAEKPAKDRVRQVVLPIWEDRYDWWTKAVDRQLRAKSINQKQLAAELKRPESEVSRCINRKKPLYLTVIAISDYLTIAYPVILPETEDEALALAAEKRTLKRVAKARDVQAGVAGKAKEDQGGVVASEHADSPKAKTSKPSSRQERRRGAGAR